MLTNGPRAATSPNKSHHFGRTALPFAFKLQTARTVTRENFSSTIDYSVSSTHRTALHRDPSSSSKRVSEPSRC